jgi:hypothetical protein
VSGIDDVDALLDALARGARLDDGEGLALVATRFVISSVPASPAW